MEEFHARIDSMKSEFHRVYNIDKMLKIRRVQRRELNILIVQICFIFVIAVIRIHRFTDCC